MHCWIAPLSATRLSHHKRREGGKGRLSSQLLTIAVTMPVSPGSRRRQEDSMLLGSRCGQHPASLVVVMVVSEVRGSHRRPKAAGSHVSKPALCICLLRSGPKDRGRLSSGDQDDTIKNGHCA